MNVKFEVSAKPAPAGRLLRLLGIGLLAAPLWIGLPAAQAQVSTPAALPADNTAILDAREAFRKKDRARLASARASAVANRHPLAMWADYWELNLRLPELQHSDLEAFYTRWPGSYVEDRLRNDWLLELGRRRDWANFSTDHPRFRMADDRDVACYALIIEQQAGKDVRDAARALWLAQREADDACALLAASLVEARQFTPADLWLKARFAIDTNRPRAARQAVALVSPGAAEAFDALVDSPVRYLARRAGTGSRQEAELTTLALMRLAANDLDAATDALNNRWERTLPPDLAGWAWAHAGRLAAQKLLPEATDHYDRAERLAERALPRRDARAALNVPWSDDIIAWRVRALLRQASASSGSVAQWAKVHQTIEALSPAEQMDSAWRYWRARALQVTALDDKTLSPAQSDARVAEARQLMEALANELHFYGAMAAEDIGRSARVPSPPPPLSAEERAGAVRNPSLERGLQLIALGLRSEGVREWNFGLRGLNDRALLAAAQWACDREVWDRCINTSERTVAEIDLAQRFPMPHRREVVARTREIGLDAAYVYGLIRQESRFITDARSHVGASGLMQVMPATARWTANKIGLPFSPEMINDRDTNLILGTSYLKLVLDDFGGSQTLGAAAYNAGPNRPRRWREGPRLEPAVWAENIPFNETRDYVKKVLANALYYTHRLTGEMPSIRQRLGPPIGPRDPGSATNRELP